MSYLLNNASLDALFRKARTHNAWLDQPVSDDLLRRLYDLMKWGPTSANCCPARILFLRTQEAKQRLAPALAPGNLEKTMKPPEVKCGKVNHLQADVILARHSFTFLFGPRYSLKTCGD